MFTGCWMLVLGAFSSAPVFSESRENFPLTASQTRGKIVEEPGECRDRSIEPSETCLARSFQNRSSHRPDTIHKRHGKRVLQRQARSGSQWNSTGGAKHSIRHCRPRTW